MKQFKPVNYYEHITPQHLWFSQRWDLQHEVPSDAKNQAYDTATKELTFVSGGIEQTVNTLTPPPWVKKRLKEA